MQALDAHAYDHRAGEGRARFIGKQDALAGLAVGTADPGRGLAQFGRSFAGRSHGHPLAGVRCVGIPDRGGLGRLGFDDASRLYLVAVQNRLLERLAELEYLPFHTFVFPLAVNAGVRMAPPPGVPYRASGASRPGHAKSMPPGASGVRRVATFFIFDVGSWGIRGLVCILDP